MELKYVEIKRVLLQPMVPMLMCLFLTVLIFWQMTTGLTSFFSINKQEESPKMVLGQKKRPEIVVIKQKLQTPFFGEYVPTNLNEGDIKQSMLDLTLVGIIFADREQESQVIIRMASGKEENFKVGDTLTGNIRLKRITSEGILIQRNGALESLSLPKNELIFQEPAKPLKMDLK